MADNTFNFDLDAPAVPTLTLDPAPAQEQAQPKQPEPAAAPEAQVKLSPEEQAMVCLLYRACWRPIRCSCSRTSPCWTRCMT